MIAEPPLEAGAVQIRATCPFPRVAELSEGAPGVVAGVALSGLDAAPVPTALVAVTVKL